MRHQSSHLKRTAAIIAVATLPFLAACGDSDTAATPAAPPVTAVPPVTVPPVTAPPVTVPPVPEASGQGGLSQEALEGRIGQPVTVTGEVATRVGPNAFTLGGDQVGENPVLVVSATAPKVDEGDTVTVAGTVIRFTVAGVESDLDLDIVDNEFSDFVDDPALQATSVTGAQD